MLIEVKTKLQKFIKLLKNFLKKDIVKKVLTLIIIPILIFSYCQLFCNGKFFFEPKRIFLNYLFIYLIIGLFYFITGKLKKSLYISAFLTFIIGIINNFVTSFRGTPLVPWDIFSLNVALKVLPTFSFNISIKTFLRYYYIYFYTNFIERNKFYKF